MKKIIKYGIYSFIVCLIIGIGVGVYLYNKPQRDIEGEKPVYTLTASELYIEFSTNEALANQKYLSDKNGKVIQISGTVSNIILQGDSAISFMLTDKNMVIGDILCSVDNEDLTTASKVKKGDKISLKGECTGYIDLTNEVSMSKCFILE